MPQPRVAIQPLGLPPGVAPVFAGGGVRLLSHSQHHLLLGASLVEGEVQLAGVLGELTAVDLLSFLNLFRKSGRLHFMLPGGTKDLYFAQGELVAAASTYPEDELGEFLCAAGALDRDVLLRVRRQAGAAPEALRCALLGTGLVSPTALWAAGRAQVEAIVYRLLSSPAGSYVFLKCNELPVAPHFSLSTQTLIMEGLRQADERLLFMRVLRSLEALPIATGQPVDDLPLAEERLLALAASGRMTVRELVQRSGLAEFDGLRLLYQLTEKQLLRIEEPPLVPVSAEVAELIAIFNGALAILYAPVSARNPGIGLEVRHFLRDLPQPLAQVFRHLTLKDDGTFEAQGIAANLTGLGGLDQQKLLAEAMNELLFMVSIAARRDLGEVASTGPVQRVQEISRRVKTLIERNNG